MASTTNQDDEKKETELVATASAWAAANGIVMTTPQGGPFVYEPAPFSLYPTPFPQAAFAKAYDMALPFNGVVHRAASRYHEWLRPAVETAARGDADFTGRLVQLADEVVASGGKTKAQSVVLGIFRSDYMLHSPQNDWNEAIPLQVELNTISSSFGCLSSRITQLHQYMALTSPSKDKTKPVSLPENRAAVGLSAALAAAHAEYVRQVKEQDGGADKDAAAAADDGDDKPTPAIFMIVKDNETNTADQRDLEFRLAGIHKIPMIRCTMKEVATMGTYIGKFGGKELMYGKHVASVVYFRAGYSPDDYPAQVYWEGRHKLEHSAAIKCPDVFYHLFGSKKVQQVLAEPGVLNQFCASEEEAQLLSSCFAGLYALGDGDDSATVQKALANPHDYVLKPQREGGGNNLYDDELVQALEKMSYEERGAYILMQKIVPPSLPSKGVLVRGGQVAYRGSVVCELGVFGVSLRRYGGSKEEAEEKPLLDGAVGHILRSKTPSTNEGGVAAGYAFLSSPQLL